MLTQHSVLQQRGNDYRMTRYNQARRPVSEEIDHAFKAAEQRALPIDFHLRVSWDMASEATKECLNHRAWFAKH
jgi:hypothetical protein